MRSVYASLPRWRRPILIGFALATLAATAMVPRLRAVFAPEELVPTLPADAARIEAVLGPFGDRESLLVLVRAPDVLALDALRFQHRIARHFEEERWVERVGAITTTSLPHLAAVEGSEATLDTLEDAAAEDEPDEALGRALATDPARFPMGFLSLSERLGGRRLAVAPLVQGDDVDAEERALVEAVVTRSRALQGALVSADRGLALVVVEPRAAEGEALDRHVSEARAWLAAAGAPRGASAELAGMLEMRGSMVETLRSDQLRLVLFAILGSLLVLAAGTRSLGAVVLPLASAGITCALVMGSMAALDEPLNLLNNTIAPLLVTIGLGDAVHLVARYREELARDPDRFTGAQRTMRAMAGACFLTAATTAVGFGSLAVSDTSIVRRYALIAAAGVMLGYFVTITFLPAALPSFRLRPDRGGRGSFIERATIRIASFSARRAVAVLAIALALLGATSWIGRGVRVDSALSAQLDPSSPARRTLGELESRLSGVRTLSVGFFAPDGALAPRTLAAMQEVEAWLREQPQVLRVDGPPDLLAEMWSTIAGDDARDSACADPTRAGALVTLAQREAPQLASRYFSADGARARIEVHLADSGERGTALLISRLEARLAAIDGVDTVIGGEAARSARGLDRLLGDLGGSVGLAMAIIFLMIGGLLRSARLGLVSVLPNVMPLAITLAYMAARNIPLHASTMIVFSISVGLAVDDTIHVLSRYREEIAAGRGRGAAIVRSLRSSGRAALLSASTLWVGFATLSLASFVPIRLFGELSLVALGSAIVCEILVLPALLALFGPRRAAP